MIRLLEPQDKVDDPVDVGVRAWPMRRKKQGERGSVRKGHKGDM